MKKYWTACVIGLAFLTGCEKARLDEQVALLCKEDGGIKVYEVVTLPADRFDRFGEIAMSEKSRAKTSDEFFYVWEIQVIKSGKPSLTRDHFRVIRRADGKVLGEGIGYARVGGDVPGPWHESSFQCPDKYSAKFIAKSVFRNAESSQGDNDQYQGDLPSRECCKPGNQSWVPS